MMMKMLQENKGEVKIAITSKETERRKQHLESFLTRYRNLLLQSKSLIDHKKLSPLYISYGKKEEYWQKFFLSIQKSKKYHN